VPLATGHAASILFPTDQLEYRFTPSFMDLGTCKGAPVAKLLQQLWNDEQGQDIAEYAVMLAVILVIVVGTIRLIGSNANNVFSQVGSAVQ